MECLRYSQTDEVKAGCYKMCGLCDLLRGLPALLLLLFVREGDDDLSNLQRHNRCASPEWTECSIEDKTTSKLDGLMLLFEASLSQLGRY